MIYLAATALSTHLNPSMLDTQLVEVKETKVFAGKLGYRVSQTLVMEKDGKRYLVHLPSYHDRFHPYPKFLGQ